MKLSSKNLNTIECLIKIGKRINKYYLEASVNEDKGLICKRIKGLIKQEDELIASLDVEKNFNIIKEYLIEKVGLDIEYRLPTVLNYSINDTNYSYYRLYSKINNKYLKFLKPNHLELDNLRREFMELEVELMYTFLYDSAVKVRMSGDYETASVIDLASFYTLMDHPKFELERLDSELEPPVVIHNGIGLSTDIIIRNYIELIKSKMYDCVPKIVNDPYGEAYELMITQRIKEVFATIIMNLKGYIKWHENYKEMDMYHLFVSYIKALISICNESERAYLYDSLEKFIKDSTYNRRTEFLEILKESIEEIETKAIYKINSTFLHPGIRS